VHKDLYAADAASASKVYRTVFQVCHPEQATGAPKDLRTKNLQYALNLRRFFGFAARCAATLRMTNLWRDATARQISVYYSVSILGVGALTERPPRQDVAHSHWVSANSK